ncbi:glycosyl hydrolase family 18 protein [Bacillus atrophaeus]|uniref:glycosyl hydrolase family 18 protein n=1 Tax=Bacillus atrophaeus TaxID=1452 RepID=UPI002281396E|nr:glycosyl hydrolase family 18 protein [Bacillus atrophaeus]
MNEVKRTALFTLSSMLLLSLLTPFHNISAESPSKKQTCRPEGLWDSGVANIPYCDVYDLEGREKLANDLDRRMIGYFTGWRMGKGNQDRYLVNDIPWKYLSHINYAFAHIGEDHRVSIGSETDANNPSLGMTWPEYPDVKMDQTLPYKGHFNLLHQFKKKHPDVKVLAAVGGWAETGGYVDKDGNRIPSGGFYSMTTNGDGSVNHKAINTFAESVVAFLRKYELDGIDIDYEYPTTMQDAGNPLDWSISNPRRKGLNQSFDVLMKTLREKLDQASAEDEQYYMLTIAAPSSAYLLRGMETFKPLRYVDYVNIMSYDLHGAWNEFVGPNASLYDNGEDAELKQSNIYSTPEYEGIGYLNTDWAYHYFRGAMEAGRINIGVPYYTRGWKNVSGGVNGLWGSAKGSNCPQGLTKCGDGAVGIDNIWHDQDEQGNELGAGANPMWHAKNLEKGIAGSYLERYGLSKADLKGAYTRYYDSALAAPWLWNDEKKVFLSTEDEESIETKADYVIEKGIGGVMFWDLSGDYDWYPDRNGNNGEYGIGRTLTRTLYYKFADTTPYDNWLSTSPLPGESLDINIEFTDYPLGDQNYPIHPKMRLTNNSDVTITGGSVIEFDVPTSTSPRFGSWSGDQVEVISKGHTGPNIGGLTGDFHRIGVTLSNWKSIKPGETEEFQLVYYLPISGPSHFTITIDGKKYSLKGQ